MHGWMDHGSWLIMDGSFIVYHGSRLLDRLVAALRTPHSHLSLPSRITITRFALPLWISALASRAHSFCFFYGLLWTIMDGWMDGWMVCSALSSHVHTSRSRISDHGCRCTPHLSAGSFTLSHFHTPGSSLRSRSGPPFSFSFLSPFTRTPAHA